MELFKPNCFFRNFEIQGPADRVIVYLILYIQECLGKLQKCMTKVDGVRAMTNHAQSSFMLPSDPSFPLGSIYQSPSTKNDQDLYQQYLIQLRHETGVRLCNRVYVDGQPSKVRNIVMQLTIAKMKYPITLFSSLMHHLFL